ncbi:MAG: tetratricopeptide repeat protein [Proteobacteria bacterium]|nr:tetratricopeptide repeat protein [Pseudomonadota bacterium]
MADKDYLKDALSCINRGDYEQAEKILKEGLEKLPDDEKLLNLLSWVLFQLEKYQEMIDVYKKMVKLNSQISFTMFFNLGKAYFQLGDYKSAIDAFVKTIEFVPDHKNALFYLSACYEKLGDIKSSKKVLSKIIDKNLTEEERTKISLQEGLEEFSLVDLLTSDALVVEKNSISKVIFYGSWSIVKDKYILLDGKLNKENFIEHVYLNGEGRVVLKGDNIILNLKENEEIWINGKYLVGIDGGFEGPFNKSNIIKIRGTKKVIIPHRDHFIEDIDEKDVINKEDLFLLLGIEKVILEENSIIVTKGKGRAIFLK